jgi:AMP-polyphosphate phosphotransferase
MFEAAELGRKLSKDAYKKRVPTLRAALLDAQQRLRAAPFPVIAVFAGVDGAGKGETVNLLNEWMDPRWIVTRAFGEPSDEERERPEQWRFWRELPPRGRIGLFLSSWYSRPVVDRAYRRVSRVEFEHQLRRLAEFEKTLADDGALILKFWMHLDKKAQRKRLKTLERDTLSRWRVTKLQWKHWEMYDRFIDAAEQAIRTTSTGEAPWTIVEGRDEKYRSVTVAESILHAIERRVTPPQQPPVLAAPQTGIGKRTPTAARRALHVARRTSHVAGAATVLSRLDMSKRLEKPAFDRELLRWQGELNRLQRRAARAAMSTVLVFEGADAAGKGGAIRRVTGALDAREFQVNPIAAPSDEERAHHYLWRFWRHIPRAGRVTIFDRSWYGRVLVERVEGFAAPGEWMRAYAEINQFEDQLIDHGIVVIKYWIHVTKDEQLRRFKARRESAFKSWKITDEDWRNRTKWDAYDQAVNEMVERTSTQDAPWTLVEGNDKYYARIKVLQTACERLRLAL